MKKICLLYTSIAEAFQYTFISLKSMSVAIFAALGQLVTKFSETVTQLSLSLIHIYHTTGISKYTHCEFVNRVPNGGLC